MSKKSEKYERFSGKGRTGTRQLLLQILYQYQLNQDDLESLMNQSLKIKEFSRIDQDYYRILLAEVLENQSHIEEIISKYLDRPIEQIDPIEKAIMWIAVSEILFHPDVPVSVVINEAVELAKLFGAEGSFQYVNAVIDAFQHAHSQKGK
ncbi:MAG: transcription antitermination factor NusB [Gammaproteobacteria bacterium]